MVSGDMQLAKAVKRESKPNWSPVLLLAACVLGGCQTVTPGSSVLERLQESATPAPPYRLSPPEERGVTKADMVRTIVEHLRNEYEVVDERFVQSKCGFADSVEIATKAHFYIEQNLARSTQADEWVPGQISSVLFWKLDASQPRYIAFAVADEFLLGPKACERTLVGYFLLDRIQKP